MILMIHQPQADIRSVDEYARQQLIEQIMAMAGRASKNPAAYRRLLNTWSLPTIRGTWQAMIDGEKDAFKDIE